MKIYTKRGDAGQTDLFGGQRVSKSNLQVIAYGKIDTANAYLGLVYSQKNLAPEIQKYLPNIMKHLFAIGAYLATAQKTSAQEKLASRLSHTISTEDVQILENWIDSAQEQLEPLRHFILPTGTHNASLCQVARAQVREAEVAMIQFMDNCLQLDPIILAYVNRLSDLLFVWARLCNHHEKVSEINGIPNCCSSKLNASSKC